MRPFAITCAALLACGGCTQGGPGAPAVSSETAAVAPPGSAAPASAPTTAGVQTKTYQIGPFDLPAQTPAVAMREKPGTFRFHVDEALWVKSFEPQLVDSQGNSLPGNLLHLAIVSNLGEANPLCQVKHTGSPFAAATAALKRMALPEGHGYAILPEDPLEATVILRNPTDQDYHDVYFTFTLAGEPMKSGKAMVDVAPLLLDIDPCDHAPLAVEPKAFVKKSQRFAVPETGRLIQAYGLLQDYGVEVELGKEAESKPFWKAAATINSDHQIVKLSSYEDPAGIALTRGDGLVLGVAYDNFQEQWYPDATAAAMVYVARTSEPSTAPTTAKPVIKRADPASHVQALLLR